jgi:selenocysteine lyase/cysteine desulfurase
MAFQPQDLYAHPNPLADHYQLFRVGDRILLSGHSHQAWPDCALTGQRRAFEDAAELVDDKWERAFSAADKVRAGYRRLLDDPSGLYSLASSTHDLLVKLLSSLPLWGSRIQRPRKHLVATDREFYSLERQLERLEEEGIEVTRVAAHPAETVGDRLGAAVTDSTAAVFTSTVFFSSGHIAGDLTVAAEACRRHGALLVLDVYHQLNVVPFSLLRRGLEDAYVISAGYKYCQLGEGNAFLRFPEHSELRPVATGWFAEFGDLTAARTDAAVRYNSSHDRFAGATYDPTSHYRAAEVFAFFRQQELTPELLREVSQHQVSRLAKGFDDLDLDPALIRRCDEVDLERLGGFLCLESPNANEICAALKQEGVYSDSRGSILRLGPAPYVSDRQLDQALSILASLVK